MSMSSLWTDTFLATGCKRRMCPTHYDDWVRVIFCTTLFPHHASRSNGSKSEMKNAPNNQNNTITIDSNIATIYSMFAFHTVPNNGWLTMFYSNQVNIFKEKCVIHNFVYSLAAIFFSWRLKTNDEKAITTEHILHIYKALWIRYTQTRWRGKSKSLDNASNDACYIRTDIRL